MLTKDDCVRCMKGKEFVFWQGGKYIISAVMVKKEVISLGGGQYGLGKVPRVMCELLSKEGRPSVVVPIEEILLEHQLTGGYYDKRSVHEGFR